MHLSDLIARFTMNPARILGLDKGTLSPGKDADITVFDPHCEWTYSHDHCASKSTNTPFFNWPLKGKTMGLWVRGRLIWREDKFATELKPVLI